MSEIRLPRRIIRPGISLAFVATACSGAHGSTSPDPSATMNSAAPPPVTLRLAARSDGRCCVVWTSSTLEADLSVGCFVEAFDEGERYLGTVLLPPIPPGHRRSSGFVAEPGEDRQGFFAMSSDFLREGTLVVCRPAAWHGGAPI